MAVAATEAGAEVEAERVEATEVAAAREEVERALVCVAAVGGRARVVVE